MPIASRVVRASTPRGFSLVFGLGLALTAFVLVAKDAPAQSTDPCRSMDPSKWPASSKPYFMVALDTSGSMDGTVAGNPPSCGGYPTTRLGHARCALSNMVKAYAGEVNFGLATFPVQITKRTGSGSPPATCTNGVKDGNETDIDCGGSCIACDPGKACSANNDCGSQVCTGNVCQFLTCPANITGGFARCSIGNLWTGTCTGSCGNYTGSCGTAQTGANQRSANILVPLPADDYWNSPPTAKPNTAALLSWVDNQCGDCKELFSSGSTPLNGVLRDMYRYLSTQWTAPAPGTNADATPAGSPSFATPLTGTERSCRSVNIIFITDGGETCPNSSGATQAQAAATALRNGWTIGTTLWTAKTYVIDVGGATPATGSTNIATAGGTAPAQAAINEVALSQALSNIITGANNPEVCDNADNNCNGCFDEGSIVYCNRNKTARTLALLNAGPSNTTMCCSWTTGAERTACLNAYSASINGANPQGNKWFLPCWDANTDTTNIQTKWLCVNPSEICDSADNNCEIEVDKAQSDWTSNVTDETVLTCGVPAHCPIAESCNQQDDDCDGIKDNAAGTIVQGSVCPPGCAFPTTELCNGCDDDCDGVADNGIADIDCGFSPPANCAGKRKCLPVAVAAPGACIPGVSQPGVNQFGACSATPAPDDTTCNSLDDNCNGVVDENAPPTPCTNGQPGLVYKDVNPSSQCVKGLQACNSSTCTGWVGPSTEVCDGIDNDCDGLVDAADPGLTGVGTQCGTTQGICTKGTTACVGGVIVCQGGTQPQPEICDGKDNNCNGQTDETPLSDGPSTPGCWTNPGNTCTFNNLSWNFPPGATCSGPGTLTAPCQVGALVCLGAGGWACQGASGPSTEVCDGVDNNCNGSTDDGNPGGGGACGSNVGVCKFGTNACVGGKVTCQGGTGPSPETCNTLDDDCNGTPDDNIAGLGQVCGVNRGVCKAGVTTCSAGSVTCLGEVKPSSEICDGLDNNCDGAIDNNPTDTPAALGCWNLPGATCSGGGTTWNAPPDGTCTGLGTLTAPCAPGTLVCSGTNKWVCQGGTLPSNEVCDGLDNNCNGQVDEGNLGGGQCPANGSNVGLCRFGTQSCVAGQIICQGEVTPQPEICDGFDNNCDGTADNNVVIGVGNVCGSSVGICNQGITACVNGSIQCQGGTPKGTEVCNGLDDDCDGVVDNNLSDGPTNPGCWTLPGIQCSFKNVSWDPPANATCNGAGSLTTPCKTGTLVCVGTNGWACQGALGPQPELCNGIDDNCNGATDENNPGGGVSCGSSTGACLPGTLQCLSGNLQCQGGKGPGPEICDGIDNNCDGQVDEPANVVGVGQSCGSSVGVCRPGVTACVSGGIVCQGGVKSSPEICDGKDNDCNGSIDDNPTGGPTDKGCWNVPGSTCGFATLTWDAPPNATCTGLGTLTSPCTAGAIVCQNGAWQCQGGKLPSQSETCNGIDDDCNGQVDDGNPGGGGSCGTSNVGQCKFGQLECFNGQVICRNEISSSIEICDGIDNDCDGTVDNTPIGAGAPCNGACGAGTTVCVTSVGPPPTGAIVCQTTRQAAPEVCNGLDDDCNGIVDDNLTDAPTVPECWNNPGTTCSYGSAAWDPPTNATCTGLGTLSAACQLGKLRCDGIKGYACVGGRIPSVEVCDGTDNNCDGQIDEGNPGGGAQCRNGGCPPGIQICDGGIIRCDAPLPKPEECDGIDNNCNGQVDEGVAINQPCFPDYDKALYPGDRTQGLCRPGQTVCDPAGGGSLICNGGNGPSPEVCDNQDNDCDGKIDEAGAAPDGIDGTTNPTDPTQKIGAACGSSAGQCKPGTYSCIHGQFQCDGAIGPRIEICDCLDNDCNGEIDEDPTPGSKDLPLCGVDTFCVKRTAGGADNCMCAGHCGTGEFNCPVASKCEQLPLSNDPASVTGYCINDICGTCSKVVKTSSGAVECGPPGTVDANGVAVPKCTCQGSDGCHGPCHSAPCGQGSGLACVPSGTYAGECHPPGDCRFFGCPSGKACNADKCVDDPCDPNPCGANEACTPNGTFDDHRCVGSCATVTCKAGEKCVEGACKATGCATDCPSGEVCLGNGDAGAKCGPSKCPASGRCNDGYYCEPTTGACGNDPCAAVHCPANQECAAGQCVKKTVPSGTGGSAGTAGAGGASGAGAVSGAGGTDSGATTSGGEGGEAGTGRSGSTGTGGSEEENNKAVIGLATGGGGCRCELATQGAPGSRALGLACLALTALALRRRSASEARPRRGFARRRGGSGGFPPGRIPAGAGGRECKKTHDVVGPPAGGRECNKPHDDAGRWGGRECNEPHDDAGRLGGRECDRDPMGGDR